MNKNSENREAHGRSAAAGYEPRETLKVLILASYCAGGECSDNVPCPDCLQMCNVGEIARGSITIKGSYGKIWGSSTGS